MKLTKQELVELIKEELDNILSEVETVELRAPVSSGGRYRAPEKRGLALRHARQFAGEEAAERGSLRAMAGMAPAGSRLASTVAGVAAAPMLAYDIGKYFEDRHAENLKTGKAKPTALDRVRNMGIRRDIQRGGATLDPKYAESGWEAARDQDEARPRAGDLYQKAPARMALDAIQSWESGQEQSSE